jgi:hypothetical protein
MPSKRPNHFHRRPIVRRIIVHHLDRRRVRHPGIGGAGDGCAGGIAGAVIVAGVGIDQGRIA